jgi:serine/threonine protein kinase
MDGMLAGPGQPLTRTGAVIGTPGYMPPEQAVGAPIDFRVDLYALGVILWECCTGKFLWEGESLAELCAIQLAMPAPSLRDAGRNVPTALAALVDRLLARNPADRPASAAEVRDELRRLAMRGELAAVAGREIEIRCFTHDPSVGSSLKFLRKTPWARARVESLYLFVQRERRRQTRATRE